MSNLWLKINILKICRIYPLIINPIQVLSISWFIIRGYIRYIRFVYIRSRTSLTAFREFRTTFILENDIKMKSSFIIWVTNSTYIKKSHFINSITKMLTSKIKMFQLPFDPFFVFIQHDIAHPQKSHQCGPRITHFIFIMIETDQSLLFKLERREMRLPFAIWKSFRNGKLNSACSASLSFLPLRSRFGDYFRPWWGYHNNCDPGFSGDDVQSATHQDPK